MAENRRSKKRKLKELLQDLLEGSSDSEISGRSQPSDDDDPEMNCPIATLAEGQKVQPPNGLLALLEKKTPENSGPEVHPDISDLLSTFLTKGLDSEGRKNTIEQYPPLKGCTALKPPEMNAEIKPCLTHPMLRQDMFLKKLQCQLAAVVSALAIPLNAIYEKIKTTDSPSHEELEKLGDPLKMVADVFYSLSNHRRYLIAPALDDSVKDVLEACPIDSLLFGQNFTEKLKSSTEAKKFGASIKKKYNRIARSGPASSKASRPSSSKQVAGSSKPGSHFFPYRQRLPKTRYRKEEEEKHRPRKRQYQR